MKKFVSGVFVGIAVSITVSAYAADGIQQIEAFLRPSLPVTLDGNLLKLESAPLMYDGSTYLGLRDVAKIAGIQVYWNEKGQTVELNTPRKGSDQSVVETWYNRMKAIEVNGVAYFHYDDFAKENNTADKKVISIDPDRRVISFYKNSGVVDKTIDMNQRSEVYSYKGSVYINVKYLPDPS
ncbi:stalk domain-containing protein [Paenibacillus allorhizosphaerae]|uniref:Copper amine oxidase-like N-terminal domain-containing protein n=1 Tax=Paenibacillus allorhizosphaerae TaxID=2849866 RepID=A0ABM8VJ93_9BACL|nr:stalk domain-containing protein [Paenibacillus allorhizosphaerae]CAG7645237.1 hypothetical protein PAECIP111802_03464 [Paenibacillus allorhizosphaerae]